MIELERYVSARVLRIGDVVQHPATHQYGQVAELHGYPSHVDIVNVDGCRWMLPPDAVLRLHHRTVDIEA